MILTIVGAMAAHCLARYRFRLNRVIYFILFSTIIFPPQITIISLFQILVQYGLYNTRVGPDARLCGDPAAADDLHPGELLRAHSVATCSMPRGSTAIRTGRSSGASALPIALPAIATTVILNFILLWNEFLYAVVLITDDANRTLPLGIQRFMGDQLEDIGMIATGLMIAIMPVIVVYAFFSEKLIQGMTAGAVK